MKKKRGTPKRTNWKRSLGIVLLFVGIGFSFTSKTLTGAVIGLSALNLLGVFGILSFIAGLIILYSATLEERTEGIDEIVGEAEHLINEQRQKFRANPAYVIGLEDIERKLYADVDEYHRVETKGDSGLRKKMLKRLRRRVDGLRRRAETFFELPRHVKHDKQTHESLVVDLPDQSLYEYVPLQGKKTKMVELDVVHYTDNPAYSNIKRAFERGEDDVMKNDLSGWTYFVAESLPEGLPIKEARRILGTGLQDYSGKQQVRNPKYEIRFKIKVPKERVLLKDEKYTLWGHGPLPVLPVRKYAIAGGISRKDIVSVPDGRKYFFKGAEYASSGEERWAKS
ncbi:MAG: DUF308 domain-containing protein [Candidatus Nanoarchaeia archaeon]|nr:DUF308 domain-containing protein [Candidatus Nanoarchaeia archaeon]